MAEEQVYFFDPKEKERISSKVNMIGIVGNALLTVLKIFAGVIAHSGAMVSDGIHSASDVLSTFIVFISMKQSAKSADKEHPYGHERFECVASLMLAVLLAIVSLGIAYSGIRKVAGLEAVVIPGMLALIMAVVSIVTKEAMYRYTIAAAKKLQSSALKASAWHHRSDAFSSVGSLIGIFGAMNGFPRLDAVASLAIACCILKVAYDIFRDALAKMVDHSCNDTIVEQIRTIIQSEDGVLGIDTLKTRLFGDRIYADAEIAMDGSITLSEAHRVAKVVHDRVDRELPQVKHCMVHVNPTGEPGDG